MLRAVDENGRSLLGRPVLATAVPALGRYLGLDPDQAAPVPVLVSGILETGRWCAALSMRSIQLTRSLVSCERSLERAGFDPARLSELKALGCCTEIICYQTNLLAPVTRAAKILERLFSGQ